MVNRTETQLFKHPSDPAPGFYVSTTSLEKTTVVRKDPLRYVNAEAINLIVLPGGLKLGDFAVVIHPGTQSVSYAV